MEVWVQDHGMPGVGISGGYVDVGYTTAVTDGVTVVNQDFGLLSDGVIDDPNGVVRNLGGGTMTGGRGIAPQWARLGYVEMLATGLGEATFELSLGTLRFSRYGAGGVDWDSVDLGTPVVVDQVGGTRIDMTTVRVPSSTDARGQRMDLPASEDWVHEWELFWVEIWVSTPDSTAWGVAGAMVDVHYHTDYLTAMEIVHGPAFTENLTGTIDDALGLVSAIGGVTERTDVGDDAYVLLARVRFGSIGNDQVPVVPEDCFVGPYDMQLSLSEGQTQLVGAGSVAPELGEAPDTELWAVMYDFGRRGITPIIQEDNLIDFGDFSLFAVAFGKSVGSAQLPYTCWADFDRSGLVDFGDLAFFAPNFGKTRAGVQAGAQAPIVFPSNFPDAWRNGSGTDEGQVQWAGGEGEAQRSNRISAGSARSHRDQAPPSQWAWAVDEAHAALQAERSQGSTRAPTAGREVRPILPLRQESPVPLYSRSDTPVAPSGERPNRQFGDWQPLEDWLSSLAGPQTDWMSDDVSNPHEAFFNRIGN